MSHDPWETLGLTPTSNRERIREAYLTQVRQHHPDQFRSDPVRYQKQEEQMKRINEAYQWALKNPPITTPSTSQSSANPKAPPEPPLMCPLHRYQAIRRCKRCRVPICLACVGVRESLCNLHYQKMLVRHARTRVLREWGPLIALIVIFRGIGLPDLETSVSALLYLAVIGFRFLLHHRWFGCLALLLLPYSLVLAGAWSLVESLRQWNGPVAKPPSKTS